MTTNPKISQRLMESLAARSETTQWEELIENLLRRLELDPADRAEATKEYENLADHLAAKLDIPRHDVEIFPQGSMRTQTTISQRYPIKFDLDVVVKLTGPKYHSPDPEVLFAAFGEALKGREDLTGEPDPKRRCWRLNYPNKRYYFDVTPAVIDQTGKPGSSLSVRDPDTRWAPSNPEEFAVWFEEHARERFPFQSVVTKSLVEARTTVAPVPDAPISVDDILRRTTQVVKLHRDTRYLGVDDKKKEVMPISVIIVTLLTKAYAHLLATQANKFKSPIAVVLALVETMLDFIEQDSRGNWVVANPKLGTENFADKWNLDGGARHAEFLKWHDQLEKDLDALLHQNHRAPSEDKIRSVFGQAGVEAWKATRPRVNVLDGLVSSAAGHTKSNPTQPLNTGSKNTLG